MKNLFTTCVLLVSAVSALTAAPARRGILQMKQPDGTQIQVRMWGDEWMSITTDAQTGECLTLDEQTQFWRPMTEDEVQTTSEAWTNSRRKALAANNRYKLGGAPTKGSVHLPVLLVQFPDLKFSERYGSTAYYDSVFNQKDYDRIAYVSTSGVEYHTSSARHYFNDQSLGLFDPSFDIIGPVTLDSSYTYYGKDQGNSKDVNISKLYAEAVKKANASGLLTNAALYDGDKNGNVDLLYIIYAGWGQNECNIADYIWAKNTSGLSIKTTDGTYVNLISCSCELRSSLQALSQTPDGIGVLVHEFSHALGLPDFYATTTTDGDKLYQRYGMDGWSVMDQGSYSGQGQIPGNYTVHERLQLGWINAADLDTVPAVGRDTLPPFATTGKAMIMRNPQNPDEYITLENHYPTANLWDKCWGNSSYYNYTTNYGLLVTHVDYDKSVWTSNSVNNSSLHQHCNPLPADGNLWAYETLTSQEEYKQWKLDYRADIFPGYNKVDTLNGANPKAVWYTGDTMAINITSIKILADGNIELTFGNYVEPAPEPTPEPSALTEIAATKQPAHRKVMTKDGRLSIDGYDLLGRAIK